MKKFKKVIGLVLAFSMLPAVMPAKAASAFDVSGESYVSNSWNKVSGTAQITSRYARSGNYALYVNRSTTDARMDLKTIPTMNEAGEYTVEFWFKGSYQYAWNVFVNRLWAWSSAHNKHFGAYTKGETDAEGWTKYSYTFTLTDAQAATNDAQPFKVYATASTAEFVIDDITLYKSSDTNKTNLLSDGGFEDSYPGVAMEAGLYSFNNWNRLSGTAYPTKSAARGGKGYSLYVNRSTTDVRIDNKTVPVMNEAGDYTVEFWFKGSFTNTWDVFVNRLWAWSSAHNIHFGGYTAGEVDDEGWTKYSYTFTLTDAQAATADAQPFKVVANNTAASFYIDDIVLYKSSDANKTNLLTDGSFEDVTVLSSAVTPTNLMAYPVNGGGALNISWTNPTSVAIAKSEIYLDGEKQTVSGISNAASAFNQVAISGLKNNREYEVKLVMYICGNKYEYTTTGTPDARGPEFSVGDWTVTRFNLSGIHSNFIPAIDTGVGTSNNTSFKMNINIPTATSNLYPNIRQAVTVRRDTQYQFSFKAKTENIERLYIIAQYLDYKEDGSVAYGSWVPVYFISGKGKVTSDWTEYKAVFGENVVSTDGTYNFYDAGDTTDKTYAANIRIVADIGVGNIWIDDVEMKALSPWDDGGTYGDNLIRNGGFDYTYEVLEPTYKLITEEGSEVISNLVEGNIEVTAKVKNYTMDNYDTAVIVALFDGDELESVTPMERKLNSSSVAIPAEEFTTNVRVPALDTGNYCIKVMYWNGIGSMEPINSVDELKPLVVE